MKLFVYVYDHEEIEKNKIVAVIHGKTNQECEKKAVLSGHEVKLKGKVQ